MKTRLAVVPVLPCAGRAGHRHGARSRRPRALDGVVNALTFRNIGPFRTAAWVTEVAVPETPAARSPLHDLRGDPQRRAVEDDERRDDLDERSPTPSARRRSAPSRSRPSNPHIVWMGTGDQANARSSYLGQGRLQVDGRRRDLAVHGAARLAPHRAHRHPPEEPGRRLRRGDRPPLLEERGARRLPDDGRRQDVEEGALRQRRRRRDRPRRSTARRPRSSTPRCTTRIAGRGRSSRADPRAAIYRTDDGGDKWTKLGGGLPTGKIGRIGLDIYQKNPLDPLRAARKPEPEAGRRQRATSAPSARSPPASSATSSIAPTTAARRGGR